MTKLIDSHVSLDGPLVVTTENNQGTLSRRTYVFQRTTDYNHAAVEAYQIGSSTNLILRSGFTLYGEPYQGKGMQVWADGTDMPVELAVAMLNYVYPSCVFVHTTTEYDQYEGVTSHNFDVVIGTDSNA